MPLVLPSGLMVSVSGFRGRVGDPLTPELVTRLAAAYGSFLQAEGDGHRFVVGRDTRTSGPMLQRAAVAGLLSAGCQVTELGAVPTPTVLMAASDAGAAGAIVVTASHNPAEWNALKFAVGGGTFLPAVRMNRFLEFLRHTEPQRVGWDKLRETVQDAGAADRHLERILALPFLEPERIQKAELRVALDCVNGVGSVIMPKLLSRLGCEVSAIGVQPNGRFPRDPEPTAQNLAALGGLVVRAGAAIGLAVDPDADRLSLVDEKGRALGEDLTLALAADVVLRRTPGAVVTNLSTSRVVEDVARRHKCPTVRVPVGEIHVAARMIEEGAVVGGEGNGGVIVPALHHTRDAAAGAALVLQYLVDAAPAVPLRYGDSQRVPESVPEGRAQRIRAPFSRAVATLPSYQIVKEKVACDREALPSAYRAIAQGLPSDGEDRTDGLRLAWEDERSWLHVRPSGTEPVVRLIAEAPEAEAAQRLVDRARLALEKHAGG